MAKLQEIDETEKVVVEGESEIAKFYDGCNVLVTGASGFLGRLLVEKLLRSCSGISKLTIIMRSKKGKTPEERYTKLFEDVVFDRLRQEQPDFHRKIRMMEGDMAGPNLNLSEEDQKDLRDTHVIFHAAATVRFEETLRSAADINVKGTKELLRMAKEMPNMKVFVYVSTAFAHCIYKFIDEKYYKPPLDGDKLLTLLDVLGDQQLEQITPLLLGKWPNTYAFTKAIAEDVIRKDSEGMRACIVRPSIVVSTAKEPTVGWTNNIYGATGVVVGVGIGLMRTLHCSAENTAEIIPADYVISNIIAASWDVGRDRRPIEKVDQNANLTDIERVPIFNCVSSPQNPISWGQFLHYNKIYGMEVPSTRVLWYYMFSLHRNRLVHQVATIFLHLLPALIMDTLAYMTGRKPILMKAYKKIHKFSEVISYFSNQEWRFCNDAVVKLWDRLSPKDKELFTFNIADLDWNQYFYYYIRGLRVYLINDPMDTVEVGRKKYQKLKIAHYTLCTILWVFFLYVAVLFLRFLWSFCPYSDY